MDEQVKNFCYYYDAKVEKSGRCFRRPVWTIVGISKPSDDFSSSAMPVEEVPIIEIHMPEDRFRHLIEMRDQWNKTLQRTYHKNDVGNTLWHQHEKESRLRHQFPALQNLWEQYQAMLALIDGEQ